jgi:homoserine dehydrogenase
MATSTRQPEQASFTAARRCKVALAGFGTVGQAVAKLLAARADEHSLELTHVFNRGVERKKASWNSHAIAWTEDYNDILRSDADIVVELVGGVDHAHQWVRSALESGKSVVTANKQLMARHGGELLELARRSRKVLAYGAAVAGGIPVISGLHEGLGGDRLQKVCGVLNGTCNYILTRIERDGATFEDALGEAQKAGFAEADPTDDVDGYDARAKLVILVRAGLNAEVSPEQMLCRSIRPLRRMDFDYANRLGCTIRQVSRAELGEGVLRAAVEPALVSQESPLARVSGSQNLVMSTGEFGGETVFSGYGAGGNPTAVAVVSDLLHVVRLQSQLMLEADRPRPREFAVNADFLAARYLRFVVRDGAGIIAALAHVLADHELNIDSILQLPGHEKTALPFVITLEPCRTSELDAAMREIDKFSFLAETPLNMPILP